MKAVESSRVSPRVIAARARCKLCDARDKIRAQPGGEQIIASNAQTAANGNQFVTTGSYQCIPPILLTTCLREFPDRLEILRLMQRDGGKLIVVVGTLKANSNTNDRPIRLSYRCDAEGRRRIRHLGRTASAYNSMSAVRLCERADGT